MVQCLSLSEQHSHSESLAMISSSESLQMIKFRCLLPQLGPIPGRKRVDKHATKGGACFAPECSLEPLGSAGTLTHVSTSGLPCSSSACVCIEAGNCRGNSEGRKK